MARGVLGALAHRVALFTRAWIEMGWAMLLFTITFRRPLYEGVD